METKKITPTMIAKDVLKLLAAKKIKARRGDYVCAPRAFLLDGSTDARTAIRRGLQCYTCAIGASFVAHIMRTNGVIVGDLEDNASPEREKRIESIFGEDQADLIEIAFERRTLAGTIIGRRGEGIIPEADAIVFGNRYKTDHNRLVSIMQNIIANNGTFRPEASKR